MSNKIKSILVYKNETASFDIDAQRTFTPLCPNELPVPDGDKIADELNKNATFASLRIASRDAHPANALWIASEAHPCLSPIQGQPNMDIYWTKHAIVGTYGFSFIPGLDPEAYDFQVYKGVEPDKHPYGACYHNLKDTLSTGVIEYLKANHIHTVICGGLATDYCVLNTVRQLNNAGFHIILNKAACRGIAPDTTEAAVNKMETMKNVIVVKDSSQIKTI